MRAKEERDAARTKLMNLNDTVASREIKAIIELCKTIDDASELLDMRLKMIGGDLHMLFGEK